MIDTYQETDEKEWIEATVTIDGETFERVGLRLKGNSSLRGVSDDAETDGPAVADPARQVRRRPGASTAGPSSSSGPTAPRPRSTRPSRSTCSAEAGLASEHAVATSFSVNGSDAGLRLVVQNLDERVGGGELLHRRPALQGRGRRRLVLPRRRPRLLHRRLRPGDRRRRPHAADRLPRLRQQQQRRGVRRRAARAPRRRGLRPLPRLRGGHRQLRRHRRPRQQLLPPLRRGVRRLHRRRVGPQPRLRHGGPGGGGRREPPGASGRGTPSDAEGTPTACRRERCPRDARRRAARARRSGRRHGRVQRPRRALHRGRGVGRPGRAGEGRPDRGALRQRLRRRGPRPVDRACSPSRPATSSTPRPSRRRPTPSALHRWLRCEERQRRASKPSVEWFRGSLRSHLNHRSPGTPSSRGRRSSSS